MFKIIQTLVPAPPTCLYSTVALLRENDSRNKTVPNKGGEVLTTVVYS